MDRTTPSCDTSQILSDYQKLEPGESDTWNPLKDDFELFYRLSFFYSLTKALRLIDLPIESLKVLDMGCGNGRSARVYIDLGLKPKQIVGVDLRSSSIALAKKLNPAIQFETYDGTHLPFADNYFNFINISGVFSSIKSKESRQNLIQQVCQKLEKGGHVFYYDLYRANGFAGGDLLVPKKLFSNFKIIWHSPMHSLKFISLDEKIRNLISSIRGKYKYHKVFTRRPLILSHINPFSAPAHEVLLAQKHASR